MTRREVLWAGVLGIAAAVLAACGRAVDSPSSAPGPTATPGSATVPAATASTTPTVRPTPTPVGGGVPTLREKIARMMVVGFRGRTLEDLDWLKHDIGVLGVGGVILFDRDQETGVLRNVESPAQARALVAELKALAPQREVIVAIDQEGGIVTRLSPKHGFPALASEAAIGEQGDSDVQAWADGLVATLAAAGINLNFAPVVDLDVNPDNPAVGALDRAFSADPAVVSRDAEIELQAHRAKGIRTALKHFPGLGSATANTDFGVADVTATWTAKELDPYRALIGTGLMDLVMAAHVVNGQIEPNVPASLSKATITDLLRGELGWDGIVVTDDMQAAAITETFGADDAVAMAIEAGCDLLLFANQQIYDPERARKVIDLVERLVEQGRIPEARIDESVTRLEQRFPSGAAPAG
ncbi:MAG TPA: glycoside hydrolase family 3 N-terminal domain-containing protein [Candidatus Limnocylindria bacterium]|nr:glycoside hydrolase family 3 N-terminal domain-containing protein [Candidatus Limnocylindria bacterium]